MGVARWDVQAFRFITVLSFFIAGQAQADLVLTSPPRESAERGEEMYGPLAQLLTTQLGVKVVYYHPRDWIEYAQSMRKDKYDIIFDGPHFAAWRMKHLDHRPVAKLPGKMAFVVVARQDDKGQNGLRDLINGPVCGQASPNLGTMAVLAQFKNPIIQPDLYEVSTVSAAHELMQLGKCRTAVMQDKFLFKLSPQDKQQLKVIFASESYPDQTITVSKRVTDRQRAVLAETLARPSGLAATQLLLQQYSRQSMRFVPAQSKDYDGLETLLEGALWGW